jgi:two-component system sensor histidine kinase UhpB
MRQHHARAMYDQIEGMLTSITKQLRSTIQADAEMPARVANTANAAWGSLQRSSGWTRQVVTELGSVLLDTLGLAATIEWHLHQFQKCTGMLYELTVNESAGFDLPEEYAAAIFGAYCESLSNVARHAGASRVVVALTITPHEVTLVVSDNGIGFDDRALASGAGGLATMRARLQAARGSCRVTGARNDGTTVTANLPIPQLP